MRLIELIDDIVFVSNSEGFPEKEITGITTDSRKVKPGFMFVCVQGASGDGHNFIDDALKNGAAALIIKHVPTESSRHSQTVFLNHKEPGQILPDLLNRFYGYPSDKLSLIGITGTNGKTTTTYLIESIYQATRRSCGVIGTVNYRFGGQVFEAKNTTPGLSDIVSYFEKMVAAGVEACVMEVSSHALVQQRVRGLTFEQAVFSNLTSDHLDYHHTREEYFLAKARFFDGSNHVRRGIINIDDPYGGRLVDMSVMPVLTYGIDGQADVKACDVKSSLDGSEFLIQTPKGEIPVKTALIGKHNIYNILAAAASCLENFSLEDIRKGVENLRVVPGRLERIEEAKDIFVFVDYAHTEDALKNVLESIDRVGAPGVITVFGCGGDRDRTKRPKMAAVVEKYADKVIVTNDNPRTEDPSAIVEDILKGFTGEGHEVVLDRREAIRRALETARPGDCVLIAGKGHEDYQIFKDRTVHFDDREEVRNFLREQHD